MFESQVQGRGSFRYTGVICLWIHLKLRLNKSAKGLGSGKKNNIQALGYTMTLEGQEEREEKEP